MVTKSGRTSRSFTAGGESSLLGRKLLSRPLLLNLTDLLLFVLVSALPFVMGGREAPGHWLLVSGSLLLGAVWCLYSGIHGGRLRLIGLEPLLLLGLLLVWFQTQAQPAELLRQVSPETEYLTPAWAETQLDSGTVGWSTISFIPAETRHGFLILLAYGIFGAVLAQRLRTESDCHVLFRLIGLSGLMMAAFAAAQLMLTNGKFFWFYEHPFTDTSTVLKGAFTNRNHFAQYLSLALAPLLWWSFSLRRKASLRPMPGTQRSALPGVESNSALQISPWAILLIASAAALLVCSMLSLSRGGMVSTACVCGTLFLLLWRQGQVTSTLAMAMLLLGGLAVAAMMLPGSQGVERRVSQLASLDADHIDSLNARRSIWDADLRAIRKFPWLGTGIGSHRFVYGIYMENLAEFRKFVFSHAESSYIHLALEGGLAGLGLLGVGLFLLVLRQFVFALRYRTDRAAAVAVTLAAVLGGMVHACADFIWYVPAIVITTTALAVTGLRMIGGFSETAGIPCPRPVWLSGGIGCLLLLGMVQQDLWQRMESEHFYFRYLISLRQDRDTKQVDQDAADVEATVLASARFASDTSTSVLPAAEDWARIESQFESPSGTGGTGEESVDAGSSVLSGQPLVQSEAEVLQHQFSLLTRAWKASPQNVEVCLHLSRRSLDLFEELQQNADNPLPLIQIRDAVRASEFANHAQLSDFLGRAFGENFKLVRFSDSMARRALGLCPLLPKGYRALIQTGFIHDHTESARDRMMAQAMRLGKHDPAIRLSIGQALFFSGRSEEAQKQFQIVFHSTQDMRREMLKRLAGGFPAELVLQTYEPNLREVADVMDVYSGLGRTADFTQLVTFVMQQTVFLSSPDGGDRIAEAEAANPDELLEVLMHAYRLADRLGADQDSELLLRRAMVVSSTAESPRRGLGLLMMDQERYEEAEAMFAQCYELSPGDVKLEELRRECRRLYLQQQRTLRTVSSSQSAPIPE